MEKVKRVYFINCTYGHGGPGDVAKNLFTYFRDHGIECRFACSRYGLKAKDFFRIGNKFDAYLHYLFSLLFDSEGFNSRIATKKLIKDIQWFKPDVISLHSLVGHFLNYRILFDFFRKTNIRVVWTLHDCSAFTGHCINFERIHCEKWKEECNKCPLKRDYPRSLMFDFSKRNFKKKKECFSGLTNMELLTPSNWLKHLVKKSFLKEYKCSCIHNGIDLSCFKPMSENHKEQYQLENKVVLLFVAGVWNEMKGIRVVKDLAPLLDNHYQIVLIGKCEEELPKTIIHINRTNDRIDLAKWYNTATVFVNPTLGDNFPTVNIEALACGKPVVTFSTGGSPESIDENSGLVVFDKDAKHLFSGIKTCLSHCKDGLISEEKCLNQARSFRIDVFSILYLRYFG